MYILDRILMADDLPNKYFAPVLLEMFALAFAFACVDAIVAGKSWRSWSGSLVVALVLSSCGFKWPWVKEKIAGLSVRTKIADWLESLARRINPAVLSQDKRTGTLTTTLNKAGARLSFDVVGDCSMSDDPAGPWKYGYSHGVGKDFNPFKARHSDALDGVDRWFCPERHEDLGVMHNRTDHTVVGEPATYTVPANMMHMHPGQGGCCAVIRWECPENGTYTIEGSFEGLDKNQNADPEVHILKNLDHLWNVTLRGVCTVGTFTITKHLQVKDNLDFVASQGTDWGSDSVGLQARIMKVS